MNEVRGVNHKVNIHDSGILRLEVSQGVKCATRSTVNGCKRLELEKNQMFGKETEVFVDVN